MSTDNRSKAPKSNDIGWRLRQLRLRRGSSLRSLAERSGKHSSQLSRLEREWARNGTPKPETVTELLDALEATPEERRAVFHFEEPAVTPEEIAEQVHRIAAEYDNSPVPIFLADDRWYRWYMNRAGRMLFGLTAEEYDQTIGEHMLLHLLSADSPLSRRYIEQERRTTFSMRAAAFQAVFADQQFDEWYLRIAEQIRPHHWAEQIWLSPPKRPMFADSLVFDFIHPTAGPLRARTQLHKLVNAPRFSIIEVAGDTSESSAKLAELLRSAGLRPAADV
ncbi:MAG: helix-turn-helix transcriptional regulator [Chloroflexota bacterium]